MYDDDPPPDPFYLNETDNELRHLTTRRNWLFVAISAMLIISLLGSSVVAFFALARANAESSGLSPAARQGVAGPTAAPATIVAAATELPASVQATTVPAATVNRIAMVNANGQIETLSPLGEERRVLTLPSDNTLFQFPAWAPDGRRLAVAGNRSVGGGIYVFADAARTGTLSERQVYYSSDKIPFYLFWSPDSNHLAFLANHTRSTMGLSVVTADGEEASSLLATGAPFYWDWSDDGRQLLIHSNQGRSNNTVALIDLQGQTQAGNLVTPGIFQAPGIAQGGRYWAFAEAIEGGLSALVVVDTQTGERQSHELGGSVALSWSPAQPQVAFTNGALDAHPYWGPLRVFDVATGETQLLTSQTVLAFFWSPDGRSIAFITLGREEDDGINAAAKLRHSSRLAAAPVQQSGRGFLTLSVVDVETGSGLRLLDFEPTVAYLAQFLPFFDQYALSHRVWSPDSSALVLPVREESGNVILVVPARGGRPYRLAHGDIAFWSHN
jgi:TolB protein